MSVDIARLRLIRSDNIGPVTYRQLLRRFGSAPAALAALPDLVRCGGGSARIATAADAEAEMAAVAKFGGRFVFIGTDLTRGCSPSSRPRRPRSRSRATSGFSNGRAWRWSGRAIRARRRSASPAN